MFYSAQKKSHKEFLSWREKKKFWFFIRRKKSEKNEKVKHLIQMGKIGNISAISVLTQFEFVYFCFCFEFTIFWNLFSEHVFYVSVRLVRREQFVRAENQSLCHSFFVVVVARIGFHVHLTDLESGKSNWRRVVFSKDLIALYWIFMNIPSWIAKLISNVNCQQLTFWLCVFLLVCFIGLRFEQHTIPKKCCYRCLFIVVIFRWKWI